MRKVYGGMGGLVFERCVERGVNILWLFLGDLGVCFILWVRIVLLDTGIMVEF